MPMPKKGDNLAGLVASAGLEHLKTHSLIFTPAGYTHPSVPYSYEVDVIFRSEYVEENGSVGTLPMAICLESALRQPIYGTVTTIDDVQYTVVESKPDSRGKVQLIMEKR